MAFKKSERKPDNIQNSKQMTLYTKFNFKFATLQKYSSKKMNHNIALIREDQRRKKIKGNKESDNLTSSNISKIAKRKITISRKHHIIINNTSTSQMSKCFHQRRSNITTMFFKQSSNNMTWSICQQLKSINLEQKV